jgi:hypothetical protein
MNLKIQKFVCAFVKISLYQNFRYAILGMLG